MEQTTRVDSTIDHRRCTVVWESGSQAKFSQTQACFGVVSNESAAHHRLDNLVSPLGGSETTRLWHSESPDRVTAAEPAWAASAARQLEGMVRGKGRCLPQRECCSATGDLPIPRSYCERLDRYGKRPLLGCRGGRKNGRRPGRTMPGCDGSALLRARLCRHRGSPRRSPA